MRPVLLPALLLSSVLAAQDPYLSELMARNASTLRDDQGATSDWIEIHNPRSTAVDMTGWYLTDDPANLRKFRIDARVIPADGHLVVHASGLDRRFANNPLHTNFTLNGDDGEFLALVKPGGTLIGSQVQFPGQRSDVSYGRDRVSGAWVFFDTPTPGQRNGTGFPGLAQRVTPSVQRGFYDRPLSVHLQTLSQPASIRFTTDGSRPTRTHGTVYSGPIQISRTTVLRTVAYGPALAVSRIDTHSYLFIADIVKQDNTPPGYPSTWGTHWTGSSNYTSQADYAMDPAIVNSARYGPLMADALRALPTISLVLEIPDLFDTQTGIYSNPLKDGKAWERPTSVEVIHPRMGRQLQGNGGVRIMGRGSRRPWINPKYSLRLLFKEGYGPDSLDVDLFGAGAARSFETIALRSAFNDSFTSVVKGGATYLRDMLIRDAHRAGGQVDTHGRFAHLFLNGMYWGVYNPSERPDADFQAHYFGGNSADYDVLKHINGVVVAGDRVAFDRAIAIANGGLASPTAYASIQQYIDVANLADYMALNLWAATIDWPSNNWYMARRRQPPGPFRFFNWDAEISLNDVNANRVDVRDTQSPAFFYDRLRANAEFRVLFGDRAHRLLFDDGPLTPAASQALFDRRAAEVRAAIVAETARWGDVRVQPSATRDQDWEPAVAGVKQAFLGPRRDKVVAQLQAASLYPTVPAATLSRRSGAIDPGAQLTIAAPRGTIYVTLDGADPRQPGGAIHASARAYTGAITLNRSTVVKARVLDAGNWSAVVEGRYTVVTLVVNEVMAKNTIGITDPLGEREDWIELYNRSRAPVTASGMYLTDDPRQPTRWRIPAGFTVPPGGTLLLFADGQTFQGPRHTNFKLADEGEAVFLYDQDGSTLLSGFRFGRQVPDVSLGQLHDGDGPLVTFPEPTPGLVNAVPCRRIFSGHHQDLHPISYDVTGPPRLGSQVWLLTKGSTPNDLLVILWSRTAGYLTPLQPANEVAVLVGLPMMQPVRLTADQFGHTAIPIGIANDPNLVGVRFYFQAFGFQDGGFRGSNALELTICR